MPRLQPSEMVGRRFGRLIVLEEVPQPRRVAAGAWRCACDCGGRSTHTGNSLRTGKSTSCGCASSRLKGTRRTHGVSRTPLHLAWKGMHQRCNAKRGKSWKTYGSKGVVVCERWKSFEAFRDDMGPSFKEGLTLERDDSAGNYEPSNCRWIPKAQQSRNRCNVILLDTPWGKLTLPETARKIGLCTSSFVERYQKGWVGDQLFAPPLKSGRVSSQ